MAHTTNLIQVHLHATADAGASMPAAMRQMRAVLQYTLCSAWRRSLPAGGGPAHPDSICNLQDFPAADVGARGRRVHLLER